jgi:hypothetical protein
MPEVFIGITFMQKKGGEMDKPRSLTFFLCAILILGLTLSAQVPTGKIVGKIVDDQGSPLPGIAVAAR